MQQHIGFNINSSEYTIPILKVREIVTMPVIRKMPQSPPYIEGLTNLRGSVIPIVNLKRLINLGDEGNIGNNVIVITSGKITFGILVDGITGVIDIDESTIEPPESFLNEYVEQIEGVAKLKDRLVILLNTKTLLSLDDMSLFEDNVIDVKETDDVDKVEVVKTIETMAGKVTVKELHDAKEFFDSKLDQKDPKHHIFEMMVNFMEATAAKDHERVENIIAQLLSETSHTDKAAEVGLYKEVGKVTRKLHDSLKDFKSAIDPGITRLANEDVPDAVDKLEFVISRTEEAAIKTIGIVEGYLEKTDELSIYIEKIKGPKKTIDYLRSFRESLNNDMTEILTSQQFQDITGQTIKKVIELVNSIEVELLKMITTFGVKLEDKVPESQVEVKEKVAQADVEDLLSEFGF